VTERRDGDESHLQERDDFEKTIDRTDPDRVERADRPPTRSDEAENVGDHSDTRVQQPGEAPPPESERP
jgi:hypothetical protein